MIALTQQKYDFQAHAQLHCKALLLNAIAESKVVKAIPVILHLETQCPMPNAPCPMPNPLTKKLPEQLGILNCSGCNNYIYVITNHVITTNDMQTQAHESSLKSCIVAVY